MLRMDNNKISHFDLGSLPPGNISVDISSNLIETVSFAADYSIKDGSVKRVVNLSSNPFRCDSELLDFLQIIHDNHTALVHSIFVSHAGSLKCNSPQSWENQTIIEISPSYLLCPVSNLCPKRCSCYYLKNNSILVNCSSLSLTTPPKHLPKNVSVVHLENNLIGEFTNIKEWEGVTELYLDNNRLVAIELWPTLKLKFLSLKSNRLAHLPSSLKEYVAKTPHFLLDIRENNWVCNCTYLPFKHWLSKNEAKLVSPNEIMCNRKSTEHESFRLHPMLNVPEDAFCSSSVSKNTIVVAVAASTTCLVCLALSVLVAQRFGNRKTFLAYLYTKFPSLFICFLSDLEDDKPYDAFISYTNGDRETVLKIIEELEENPPHLNFCIHERDWIPGNQIICQIITSVKNSKKTVIILSREFLGSFWCETEIQMAYMQSLEDRIDRLIFVEKGELPQKGSLSLDMQNFLSSGTHLAWGEKWFWEKLKYALPRVIRIERRTERVFVLEEVTYTLSDA